MSTELINPALVMPTPAEAGGARQHSELTLFFIDCLRDLYWAEKALLKALPRIQEAASTPELAAALNHHLAETEQHIQRLEKIFALCGMAPEEKKCEAMQGLLAEVNYIIAATTTGSMTREAAVIVAAQKVEHYEIASYGTLCAFAKTLGEDEVISLLQQTLEEEKEADQKLTQIAESSINAEAVQE